MSFIPQNYLLDQIRSKQQYLLSTARSRRRSDNSRTLPRDKRIPFKIQLFEQRILPEIKNIFIENGCSVIPEHLDILFDACHTSDHSKMLFSLFNQYDINQSLSNLILYLDNFDESIKNNVHLKIITLICQSYRFKQNTYLNTNILRSIFISTQSLQFQIIKISFIALELICKKQQLKEIVINHLNHNLITNLFQGKQQQTNEIHELRCLKLFQFFAYDIITSNASNVFVNNICSSLIYLSYKKIQQYGIHVSSTIALLFHKILKSTKDLYSQLIILIYKSLKIIINNYNIFQIYHKSAFYIMQSFLKIYQLDNYYQEQFKQYEEDIILSKNMTFHQHQDLQKVAWKILALNSNYIINHNKQINIINYQFLTQQTIHSNTQIIRNFGNSIDLLISILSYQKSLPVQQQQILKLFMQRLQMAQDNVLERSLKKLQRRIHQNLFQQVFGYYGKQKLQKLSEEYCQGQILGTSQRILNKYYQNTIGVMQFSYNSQDDEPYQSLQWQQ